MWVIKHYANNVHYPVHDFVICGHALCRVPGKQMFLVRSHAITLGERQNFASPFLLRLVHANELPLVSNPFSFRQKEDSNTMHVSMPCELTRLIPAAYTHISWKYRNKTNHVGCCTSQGLTNVSYQYTSYELWDTNVATVNVALGFNVTLVYTHNLSCYPQSYSVGLYCCTTHSYPLNGIFKCMESEVLTCSDEVTQDSCSFMGAWLAWFDRICGCTGSCELPRMPRQRSCSQQVLAMYALSAFIFITKICEEIIYDWLPKPESHLIFAAVLLWYCRSWVWNNMQIA